MSNTNLVLNSTAFVVLLFVIVPRCRGEELGGPLRDAQTATCTFSQFIGNAPAESTTVMMLGRHHVRAERADGSVFILDAKQKTMLQLDPATSTAIVTKGIDLQHGFSLFEQIAEISRIAGKPKPMAQRLKIDGLETVGLLWVSGDVTYRVWINAETGLPARLEIVRAKNSNESESPEIKEVWSDISYDVQIDTSLFSIEPPQGWPVTTRVYEGMPSEKSYVNVDTPDTLLRLRTFEKQVERTIENVIPTVVAVESAVPRRMTPHHKPFGSGVIVSRDGLVLSQAHVSHGPRGGTARRVPGAVISVVLSDGREVKAKLLGADSILDISLLKIVEPGPYPHATLAAPVNVEAGDWVVKLGHPLGYRADRPAVSRLGRVLCSVKHSFVADCPISGGDSGGPVFNIAGQLVGVVRDSGVPMALMLEGESTRSQPLYSYTPTAVIGSMIDSLVRSDTEAWSPLAWSELMAEFRGAPVVKSEQWTRGTEILAVWNSIVRTRTGSVVRIERSGQPVALGTVVGADGWILTKASEISADCKCRLPGGVISTPRIVGVHPSFDLALLKLDERDLSPVDLSENAVADPGSLIAAMGTADITITCGIVSVQQRQLRRRGVFKAMQARPVDAASEPKRRRGVLSYRRDDFPEVFEHDMPLIASECGGPVVDLDGNFIGITIARIGTHGCMAIPGGVLNQLLPELKAGRPEAKLPLRNWVELTPTESRQDQPPSDAASAGRRAAEEARRAAEKARRAAQEAVNQAQN